MGQCLEPAVWNDGDLAAKDVVPKLAAGEMAQTGMGWMQGVGLMNRLSRHLRISRSASAMLVQAHDEPTLLHEMCDIVTNASDCTVAWISLCEASEGTTSHPVAWSGAGAAALRRSCWTRSGSGLWGNGLSGPGSAAAKPCVLSLRVPHPALDPWRQEAVKHGYSMAASFPLITRGQMLGCLTVLTAVSTDFDVIELELLGQLADGLSYGLAALRDRQARAASVVQLQQGIEATVVAIASMLDERDPYTAGHQRRTASLAVAISREIGLTKAEVDGIRIASLIHDVGKIATPAEILNRPGKLTPPQFEIVKAHAQAGFDIVKGIAFPWPVAQTILQHHERLDGTGYPNGLRDDAILLEARIVAVADVVEAINSFRPYRPSLGIAAAITAIEQGKGRHFDPDIVQACVMVLRNRQFDFEASAI